MHAILSLMKFRLSREQSANWGANALAGLAAIMAFRFGSSIGHDATDSLILGLVFALGAFFSLILLDIGVSHWRHGRRIMGVLACLTWGFIICLEIVGHTAFGAFNRTATIHTATLQNTAYEDVRAEVDYWATEVAKLQSGKRPSLTAAEAQSIIDTSQAHRYWARTDGCKKAPGPQTTAFCKQYFDATAALSGWGTVVVEDRKLAAAQASLEAAKAKSASAPNEVAAANVQAASLASVGTFSRRPSDDQIYWTTVLLSLATALFMVMSGIIKAVARTDGAAPPKADQRKPLPTTATPGEAAAWLFGEVKHAVNPAAPGIAMTASAGLGSGAVGTLRAA